MDIRDISNFFNQIAQAMQKQGGRYAINYYHYGWNSDRNITKQNNFTGDNTNGKLFPALHLDFGTTDAEIKSAGSKATTTVNLVFEDLQGYNNGSEVNQRSVLDLHADLFFLANAFIRNVNKIGRSYPGGKVGVTGRTRFTYSANQGTDRKAVVVATFTLSHTLKCPADEITSDSIENLSPPNNLFPVKNLPDLEWQNSPYWDAYKNNIDNG